MKLGAHMSIAGGVDLALARGAAIGCDAIQIFLKSNMQWRSPAYEPAAVARFRAQCRVPVFAHSSYLINLAAPDPRIRRISVQGVVDEIERATTLGVPFIVMHPGAHLGTGEETGIAAVAGSLDEAFAATPGSPVKIALETTAGQGSCLGHRFEHLAGIIERVRANKRVAVCVDTCHLFAAGYDIRTSAGYETTMKQLVKVIGQKRIVAFHLNDSKKPLGSRVDRHEHIGQGHLGREPFRYVLNDPRWANLPAVLETPKSEDLHEDVENLRVLRSLLVTCPSPRRTSSSRRA